MENEERDSRDTISHLQPAFPLEKICPACGRYSNRGEARFCLDCGKPLNEDYQPLDALRSSYGLQRKSLAVTGVNIEHPTALFEQKNKNAVSETAWACVVYSMVPYLGILFVPLGVITGGFGVYFAHRNPHLGGKRLAMISVVLSFAILALQIFLWWLLYIIPEIGIGV